MVPTLREKAPPPKDINYQQLSLSLNPTRAHRERSTQSNPLMKILLWNCRGANGADFRRNLKAVLSWNNPTMVCFTETKMKKAANEALMVEFWFTNMLHVDAIGYSEGMIMLWREHEVAHVDPIAATNQEIHANVQVSTSSQPCILSWVYASTSFNNKKIRWDNLEHISVSHAQHWILCGDFNEITSAVDKFGGNPINNNRANALLDCLQNINMVDLRFTGSRFTWSNLRTKEH
ncbi:uncharacterized protein [Nicotiana tomentosiformis]|uniref:uncharacterized protein n=1 Tax=Nicotiana tomentosiformis TaxID=4098 RepID=UPI00388C7C60